MEHRKRFSFWLVIGIMLGAALACTGCSVGFSGDLFYAKGSDPREAMPWYGGANGGNHGEGVKFQGFDKLGD